MKRSVPLERFEDVAQVAGLTAHQVEARRACYGQNSILDAMPSGRFALVRETAKDPMLWFLLATSAIFALIGDWTESIVLLAALIPFVGMDAYLHRRTRASTEGLSSHLATQALVERDGRRQVVASVALVPGDLAVIGAGDTFPADGVLVQCVRMQVEESSLTGESLPVHKEPLPFFPGGKSEASVETRHWGYAGTRVLTGNGLLRVVYTGQETLYGQIVRSAIFGTRSRTPLQDAVARLVAVLVIAAGVACFAIAWVRFQQGHGLLDAFLSAVTLAVAALPEEFPVVLTFFLGVGVYRLARKQALVRRAVAVENIGRVTCICSDKTGTITEGQLRLTHLSPAGGLSDARLVQLAAAASRAETGDPMDLAILDATAGMPAKTPVASYPFTEDRKRETGIVREDGFLLAVVKGAPEIVFGQCDIEPGELTTWQLRVEEFAAGGHKVIACACRRLDTTLWCGGEPDRHFRLAGLLCFEDPVRRAVSESVEACRKANIRVIMVTGDHRITARSVAREIGLGGEDPVVVEGDRVTECLARGDVSALRQVDVIARAMPSQKLDVVRALQKSGEIVAVTGDGVNDVPALVAADIGIAMGERGTRSARDVAAIVLLDDNFASIVRAIAEGRQLFTNLQASFQYLLMIHVPLVLTAMLIPLAGYPLLYLPAHIVWLELIIHPTAMLAFQELPRYDELPSSRRSARLAFFDGRQWATIVGVGLVVTVIVGAGYLRSLGAGYDAEHARAMAMVALTTVSAGVTASLTRLRGPAARIAVLATITLSAFLVQTPALAALLHVVPLHLDDWMLASGGGLLACVIVWSESSRRERASRARRA